MSSTIAQIEKEVLALPAEQRAQLVDKLWDSLGDTSYPALSEEWKTASLFGRWPIPVANRVIGRIVCLRGLLDSESEHALMAVFASTPNGSVSSAAAVNLGFLRSWRMTNHPA
jgi:hypothetical protein